MIPAWILDVFAAVMLAVAAASAARLVVTRPWQPGGHALALADIDVAHLLMAVAMAGMLAASLRTLPNGAWAVIFAVMTAWFGYRVVRDAQVSGARALAAGHCAPHLAHAAAMVYMFAAFTARATHGPGGMAGPGGGMSGMGTLRLPSLAFVFALVLIGYGIWDLDQLSGPGASGHYSLAVARVTPPGAVLASVTALGEAGPGAPAVSALAGPTAPVGAGPGAPAVSALVGATAPVGAGPGAPAASALACDHGGTAVATDPASQALPGGAALASGPAGTAGRGILAPWVATGCRIAMGVTMAFMLLIMI
jgi:hypothetical protein